MSNNEPTIFLLLIVVCDLFFEIAVALEASLGMTALTAVAASLKAPLTKAISALNAKSEVRSAAASIILMPLNLASALNAAV